VRVGTDVVSVMAAYCDCNKGIYMRCISWAIKHLISLMHGVTLKIIITTVFPVQFTCAAFYVKRTYDTIS